jgi:hypothetical protein
MENIFEENIDPNVAQNVANKTGTSLVRIRLNKELSQLTFIMGKRTTFYFKGILKQCPNCFSPHLK